MKHRRPAASRILRFVFISCIVSFLFAMATSLSALAADNDAPTKDVPTKDVQANDVQANDAQAKAKKSEKERDKNKLEEITFDDLKLDIAKDEDFDEEKLTDRVHELHEQLVRIRGWILPSSVFQEKGIKSFVFVRDNMECCFGPGAAIYDCIIVEMEEGKTADFTTRPVTIDGVFELKEFTYPDGKHYAIYYLKGRRVK